MFNSGGEGTRARGATQFTAPVTGHNPERLSVHHVRSRKKLLIFVFPPQLEPAVQDERVCASYCRSKVYGALQTAVP